MGTMPVNRLLISMSLPMIISMLVQALYNIIDSVFVAQISEAALAAVSMAFPVQSLMIAVSTGTCVGVNALLSRSLGEGKPEEARLTAVNGIFLAILGALSFLLFGLFGAHTYFSSQTSDPLIIEYGTQYLEICTVFSFGIFGEIILERILQSTGRTIYNMYSQGAGAIINIVLDPIMIFGLFGCPAMGISGAAAATVIGQIVAMFLALYFNLKKNHDVSIDMRGFRPNARIIRIIYSVGLPSIIMQSITSVMTYGMNLILISFSATAVTVLGIYFKLQSFIFMPIFGLNQWHDSDYRIQLRLPQQKKNYGYSQVKHSHCYRHYASGTGYFPGIHPSASNAFQCVRQSAGNRDSCPAHHQPQLPVCRLLHHYRFRISGSGKRCIQPDYFCCKTASLHSAPGLHFFSCLGTSCSMVCLPHGRDYFHPADIDSVQTDL